MYVGCTTWRLTNAVLLECKFVLVLIVLGCLFLLLIYPLVEYLYGQPFDVFIVHNNLIIVIYCNDMIMI